MARLISTSLLLVVPFVLIVLATRSSVLPVQAAMEDQQAPEAQQPNRSVADPQRPTEIQTQEVPLVPAEVFDRLRQYNSVRFARFSGWSPTGGGILVGTRFGNTTQLHRVPSPGARREQLTFFEEPVGGTYLPQSQDDALLLSLSQGGNENDQVFLYAGQPRETLRLTDGQSRNRLGPIRRDGSALIIASNRRNGRDTDLYMLNPRKPDSQKMVFQTDGQYWYAADWSPDGQRLILVRYISINEGELAILNVNTGQRTDLPLPGGEQAAIWDAAFTSDGKAIYLCTDAESEFNRLLRLDLASQETQCLTSDISWDVTDLEVHQETGQVAFLVNEDGASRLFFLEGDQRREVPLPLGVVGSLTFSPDGKQLGLSLARPDAPGDAYSVNVADGRLTRWTYSEVGGLDPRRFVVPRRIRFPSFDQRMIPAYYYRPREASADKPAAVIVVIHGGPESQYRPYLSGTLQYYVNELGAAVLAPNVRGSRGYGKTYLKLDNGTLREDSVRDIGALLDWIDQQPELDASRVAVTGGSYGGYMVLASLARYGTRLQAGIDVVGIANFITFLENTADYRRDLRRAEYGDERDPQMRQFFEKINPTSLADQITSPLLIAHGKNDPRVPFSEAVQIAEKVRSLGRPVWTIYAANEGHGFAKRDNSDYLRGVQMIFLQTHLKITP